MTTDSPDSLTFAPPLLIVDDDPVVLGRPDRRPRSKVGGQRSMNRASRSSWLISGRENVLSGPEGHIGRKRWTRNVFSEKRGQTLEKSDFRP